MAFEPLDLHPSTGRRPACGLSVATYGTFLAGYGTIGTDRSLISLARVTRFDGVQAFAQVSPQAPSAQQQDADLDESSIVSLNVSGRHKGTLQPYPFGRMRMDNEHQGDPLRAEATFLLRLRKDARTIEVAIVKASRRPDGHETLRDVWSRSFTDPVLARSAFERLDAHHGRIEAWGRMGEVLGSQFVDAAIDTEILPTPFTTSAGGTPPRRLVPASHRIVSGDGAVTFGLILEDGCPRVVGRFGDQAFLILEACTVTYAMRIWDWVRWQVDAYRSWVDIARDRGEAALARIVLDAMIEQEQRTTETGTLRDTQRPLRDWRPGDE